jgi:hypothetical protein
MWVYIWNDTWLPNKDTVAYYKFNWNLNDSSGNWYNLSMANGSFTYWTESWWWLYVQTNQPSRSNQATLPITTQNFTISFFMQFPSWLTPYSASYWDCNPFEFIGSNAFCRPSVKSSSFKMLDHTALSFTPPDYNKFYHYVIVWDSSKVTLYINWTQQAQTNTRLPSWTTNMDFKFNSVGDWSYYSNDIYTSIDKLWEFIIENKVRTAEQVAWYYNQTKSLYWIS